MRKETGTYEEVLRKYWKHSAFRGIQQPIIESIAQGRDTLGLMPTGGGKSVAFQVPALTMNGVCIVVTPLIALMKDQVDHLRQKRITAAAIHSGMTRNDILATLDNAVFGGLHFLYISPERINTDLFLSKLKYMDVSFITVDEAHCICQWGYDFRPAYLGIAKLRNVKPNVPILALTATATPDVAADIQHQLQFRQENVIKMSFTRKNIAYVVRQVTDGTGTAAKDRELLHILDAVPGTAIVYTRSRDTTEGLANFLASKHGITATAYHAGLTHHVRNKRQRMWQDNEVRVMVATTAFGMGIDKADVRLVVHYQCPDSLEEYFQEAGRAGRDGKKAYAVLLVNDKTIPNLQKRPARQYPDMEEIRSVYDRLAYYYQIALGQGRGERHVWDETTFCSAYGYPFGLPQHSMRLLTQAGYISFEEAPSDRGLVKMTMRRDDMYSLADITPEQDKVLQAILRRYSGVFTDYQGIDAQEYAQAVGLSVKEVFDLLRLLEERGVLTEIPARRVPQVEFTREREDSDRLLLPPNVYSDRKQAMEKRIKHVITYIVNDGKCRCRQLVAYFGEKDAPDCGICDVCVQRKRSGGKGHGQRVADAMLAIQALLADNQPHTGKDLQTLCLLPDLQRAAMEMMMDEEIIILLPDGSIKLNNKS